MAGKRYSAGAIFLQVVPVFANVQKAIEDQAKDIDRALGDQMEESGDKAGQRAGKAASKSMRDEMRKGNRDISDDMEKELLRGVENMEKALGGINTKNLGKKLRQEIKDMRSDLESLRDVDIKVDDNFDKTAAKVQALKAQIEDMRSRSKVFFDIKGLPEVYRAAAKAQAAIDAIDGTIDLDVDTKGVERKMGAFERSIKRTMDKAARSIDGSVNNELKKLHAELDYLSRLRVGVDIGATQLKREVAEITAELDRLSQNSPDIDVRFEAGKAWAELRAWEAAVDRADRQRIDVDVDVDTAGARANLAGLTHGGEGAANSFRSFNVVLLAATSIGPALIPVLGGIAGGLLAIGPAAAVAGAGLTSVIIGFSGIQDAVQALQAQQDQAAMTGQTAAKQEISNANAVADARRAAAKAIESALKRQEDAQESYADSIKDVKDAEQALKEARENAAGTGDDINDRIKQNSLNIDQALLDEFNATVNYDAVMSDGSATNAEKEQARIDMEQAKLRMKELRDEQKELAKEKKKWDKEGVNGTEEVKSAQDHLTDAIDRQHDAYEDLQDASKAVDEARAEGARRVAEAMRQQEQAMAGINAQQNAVNQAFDKLGPAGQEFAKFIFALKEDFYDLRDAIQAVLLPQVQEALQSFFSSKSGKILRDALIGLADSFGRIIGLLSQSFQGSAWQGFFQMLADLGPKIQDAYGRAFISFLEAMASVMTTLAPYALQFAEGFASLMDQFARWAASKKGQEGLQGFMDWAVKVAPDVLDFFGALAGAFANIAESLAPWGDVVLQALTGFLDLLSQMDERVLGALLTGMVVLIAASQVAYGLMNLVMAFGALFALAIGPWILGAVAIAAALAALYVKNEKFRDFAQKAWKVISGAISDAWNNSIKPALDDLMAALDTLWEEVLAPFFKWLGPILLWVLEKVIPLLGAYFALQIRVIAWTIENILVPAIKIAADIVIWLWEKVLWPTIKAIAKAAVWLWDVVLKPVFTAIATVFNWVGTTIAWVWENVLWPVFKTIGAVVFFLWKAQIKIALVAILALFKATWLGVKWVWQNILKPVFSAIGTAAGWLWKNALKPVFGWIATGWEGLMTGMKWVWNNVLKPVFSYIGDTALPLLEGAFQTTVDAIETIWEGLKRVVGAPIKFVLNTIINKGLIDGFNAVAKWVGMDGFDHIPIPKSLQSYATGGIMPGYTPGRDPHKFTSPTGGRLELSGGEAVMRPEWTKAMGAGYVNQMNELARRGGVSAIQRAMGMGGYWMGGVLPLPGARVSSHGDAYGHPAYDMNWGSGYDDYGRPIGAWKAGRVGQMNYIGDQSYGRWVVLNHSSGSSLYAHMSNFAKIAVGDAVAAGQTIGYVGDLGNTGNPPTSHLHFEIMGGNVNYSDTSTGDPSKPKHPSIPASIMSVIKDPLGAVKGWVTGPIKKATEAISSSPVFDYVTKVPLLAAKKVADKVWDIVPGWAKTAAGWAGDAAHWVVGGVKSAGGKAADLAGDVAGGVKDGAGAVGDFLGLATGGILPYNGTMMYDNGGYLPPGLTSVVNLTGKPEPVFTSDQWSEMDGAGGQGGSIHYEPHFEGTNLTSEDVASDLNFTFRRMRRQGKYATVGEQ